MSPRFTFCSTDSCSMVWDLDDFWFISVCRTVLCLFPLRKIFIRLCALVTLTTVDPGT